MTTSAQLAPGRPVLVVDDEAPMRAALAASFERRGWPVECASGKNEALTYLARGRHSLVVSDVRMSDGNGFEVLRAARAISPATAVILLTGFGAVPDAVTAIKSGACEYLTKPVAFEHLLETAARVVSQVPAHHSGTEIVGSSPNLLRALQRAQQAAATDADILIEAESGTGKELLARRVHLLSNRGHGPFVAINCATLPEPLLESELFGHARGAFTGAIAAHPGKFQLADGGTLLLDEIGEMPLSLQPKLLRVLQEREFYPIGSGHPVRVNTRVIATTNRPLAEMVAAGTFRADLYYRLNVIGLTLPPLRERRGDIRSLAAHFASRGSGQPENLSEAFLLRLEQHDWPGNVRELANVMQRLLAMGENEAIPIVGRTQSLSRQGPMDSAELKPGMSLHSVERQLLEMTLTATGGNRSRAAEMLGVSLRTVRNKVREYSLPARSAYVHD